MKANLFKAMAAAICLFAIAFLAGRLTAPKEKDEGHSDSHRIEEADTEIWTCSMHPQVQQPNPGQCPICGMDLIPLDSASSGALGPRTLSMSESAKALASIQTSVVERRFPEAEIRLVGKLDYDETRVKSLTARFPARIDELFINFQGVRVEQGEHLARVYSPELLTAQSELLTAYRFDPQSLNTAAAREKLRLWDLRPDQIDQILKSGEASDHFELKAPISGVVVSKNVNEGDYLTTGQTMFKIVDLNSLWLKLEAYESDLAWLRFGQPVEFSVEAYPGESFEGQIVFISPEIDRKTRTVSVRVNVPNDDGKLKPGMFATATARSQVAQAGNVYAPEFAGKWISPMHPEIVKDGPGQCDICGMDLVPAEELGYVQDPAEEPPLVVPSSAVLRTGKRAIAYIEITDTEKPTYEGREIVLGPRAGDVFVVESGLSEGDRVVTKGAFKIDSALQLLAKPSMMSGSQSEAAEAESIRILDTATASALLPAYLTLQQALADDDLAAAQEAAAHLHHAVGHGSAIDETLHALQTAASLDAMRRPHFETLSNALIATFQANPDALDDTAYLMHCPMVYPDRGADWLQSNDNLRNPYFGAMMLTCGEVRGEL